MFTNRIHEWADVPPAPRFTILEDAAFVPVPASLISADQLARITAVYQAAAERTRAVLERQTDRLPRFSLN